MDSELDAKKLVRGQVKHTINGTEAKSNCNVLKENSVREKHTTMI